MARTIGKKPEEKGLLKIWDFVHSQVPDYIYGVFAPIFEVGQKKYESDVALFIPHMGVFLLDASLATDMVMEDGKLYSVYGKTKRLFDSETERGRMVDRRYNVRKYMQENYSFVTNYLLAFRY